MQSNFNNNDFEQFVKQNADQYRMFPSEKVWKGIHTTLHTRRRWYSIGFALLLLTAGAVTWLMFSPSVNKQIVSSSSPEAAKNKPATKIVEQQKIPGITINNLPVASFETNAFVFSDNRSVADELPVSNAGNDLAVTPNNTATDVIIPDEYASASPVKEAITNSDAITNSSSPFNFTARVTDDNPDFIHNSVTSQEPATEKKVTEKRESYPLSIESVQNSFKNNSRKNRFSFQLYFTPTVSYRKLRENKTYLRSAQFSSGPFAIAAVYDINSVVTHKPDLGLELGLSAAYKVSKTLKVKGGLQFNISRYDIKAFIYNGEVATIALNSGYDSVRSWTNYRNFGGYKADWLQNFYFSVSAPVGAELRLAGDDKTSLGIGGTIQPTYILGDRAYLISSDYKNYTEVPSLTRRWNVSTSLETFVNYSTGKLRWQVGPQVRYQLLSSFQEKYPVKENLFDFGLKVGIMLNK
jgi:hypothetical protein